MDRFFSKLDLRDIKIDPYSTSFPPDAGDEEVQDEVAVAEIDPGAPGTAPAATPVADAAWAARPAPAPRWTAPVAADPATPPIHASSNRHYPNDGWGAAPADTAAPETSADGPPQVEVLKVSARSRPSAVAGAIAGVVREAGRAEVQAIGAGATNQAVKAVAIARDYLRETGIDAVCLPAFIDVTIDNEDRTAIRIVVEPR